MSLVHDTPNALIIGICLMKMFEKAGWLLTGMFDCLIDANIDSGGRSRKILIMFRIIVATGLTSI